MEMFSGIFLALVVLFLAATGCVTAPGVPSPAPLATATQETRPHYTIGVDGDYPPFTYRDRDGNFTGFDIEAARWIAARQGFDAEFVAVLWDDAIPALNAGTVDMIYSGMTITPGREREVAFTLPYYTVNQSVAVRQGSGMTMQDLYAGRLRVGAQAGSTGAAWVTDNLVQPGKMPAGNLVLYPDIAALTANLSAGAVGASIIEAPVQERAVAGKSLVIIGEIPTQEQYAVAVRAPDTQLLAVMDNGLRQLMEDPYWQQLQKKYGLAAEP